MGRDIRKRGAQLFDLRLYRQGEWAKGRDVDLSFYRAHDGVMGICGCLREKDGDRLVIEQNGNLLELDMNDVAQVRLHFEI